MFSSLMRPLCQRLQHPTNTVLSNGALRNVLRFQSSGGISGKEEAARR